MGSFEGNMYWLVTLLFSTSFAEYDFSGTPDCFPANSSVYWKYVDNSENGVDSVWFGTFGEKEWRPWDANDHCKEIAGPGEKMQLAMILNGDENKAIIDNMQFRRYDFFWTSGMIQT